MMFLNSKTARIAFGIFLLALLARTLVFAIDYRASGYDLFNTIHGDDGYYELSLGLLNGHGLSWDAEAPYLPNPLRTPLYPAFIAAGKLIGGSFMVPIALQMLIGSLSAVLAFYIARRLTGALWAAVAVGVFIALEPYHMLFSTIFYTETLFIFSFLGFVLLFLRYLECPSYRSLGVAATVLALATLIKPTAEYLPVALAVLLLWHHRAHWRQGLAHAAVFCGIFGLLMVPWLYRNYVAFGVVGMTAQPAFNLVTYLAPSVIAVEQGTPIDQAAYLAEHHIDQNNITLATSHRYTKEALAIIKAHPRGLVEVVMLSAVTFFTHDGMLTVLQHAGYVPENKLALPALALAFHAPLELAQSIAERLTTPQALIVVFRIVNIGIAALFLWGLCHLLYRRRLDTAFIFAVLVVAYFAATTPINGLGVNARFRMPVEPLILSIALLPGVAIWAKRGHTTRDFHEEAVDSHPVL